MLMEQALTRRGGAYYVDVAVYPMRRIDGAWTVTRYGGSFTERQLHRWRQRCTAQTLVPVQFSWQGRCWRGTARVLAVDASGHIVFDGCGVLREVRRKGEWT
jgi:hypothetical protein